MAGVLRPSFRWYFSAEKEFLTPPKPDMIDDCDDYYWYQQLDWLEDVTKIYHEKLNYLSKKYYRSVLVWIRMIGRYGCGDDEERQQKYIPTIMRYKRYIDSLKEEKEEASKQMKKHRGKWYRLYVEIEEISDYETFCDEIEMPLDVRKEIFESWWTANLF